MARVTYSRFHPCTHHDTVDLDALIAAVATRQNTATKSSTGGADTIRCPRAEAMIARHSVRPAYGMAGCARLFSGLDDPGRYKRLAAQAIARIRRNRRTCKLQGYDWRGADARLLARAAACRRRAAILRHSRAGHEPV